jgi:hypothetical protein
MHELAGDRDAVLNTLQKTILAIQQAPPEKLAPVTMAAVPGAASDAEIRRSQVLQKLQEAYDNCRAEAASVQPAVVGGAAPAPALQPEPYYMPRDPTVALLQSAMDEHLTRRAHAAAATPAGRAPAAALQAPVAFQQFGPADPGWIEVVIDKLRNLFRGKAEFISHQSVTDLRFQMDDNVTIALVGDWGTGSAQARAVGDQIVADNPDYIVHLGDVYYAGQDDEVQSRFLNGFPQPPGLKRRFALNGNHEMYSGGHAYFERVLPAFDQPASYFSLSNQNWRIIGLDTGYVDADLNQPQMEWLAAQLAGDSVKTILLTHHQPFSVFDPVSDALAQKLAPFLAAGKIYAWFWGHEHKCIVYDPSAEFGNVLGRCIGHGALPSSVPPHEFANTGIPVRFVNRRSLDGDEGMHGFALATFNGPNLSVKYIDQDGVSPFAEDLFPLHNF